MRNRNTNSTSNTLKEYQQIQRQGIPNLPGEDISYPSIPSPEKTRIQIPVPGYILPHWISKPLDKAVIQSLTGPTTNFVLLSFDVPSQLFGIIKWYGLHCSQDTITNNITWTFQINNEPIEDFTNINVLRAFFNNPAETHIRLPESSNFKVVINTPSSINYTIGVLVRGWFYNVNTQGSNIPQSTDFEKHLEYW